MRIDHVSVKGLFGIFNHEIPLKTEDRITIIHALNGYGKTIVLRMLSGLLNADYGVFGAVPFDIFVVGFDDGSSLKVRKTDVQTVWVAGESGGTVQELEIALVHANGIEQTLVEAPIQDPETSTRSPAGRGVYSFNLDYSRLLERMKAISNGEPSKNKTEPDWLSKIRELIQVRLVQTKRLDFDQGSDPSVLAVRKYSDELVAGIQTTLAAYAARSQELDRTFPLRLLQKQQGTPVAMDALVRILGELEQKRRRLAALGFLDPKEELGVLPQRQQVDEYQGAVLSIYVRDVEEKLGVFDDLADKIGLFTEIINRRFRYKRMTIEREKGFVFTTATGALLPLTGLSSGEQHELVLLYELLFKMKPGSLVLIDEPEISLHLAWQNEFLSDLQKVVKIADFDVLVATHSADIIGDRWDLAVELKGPDLPGAQQAA